MCDVVKRNGKACGQQSRFHVHIRTVPQLLGPDGVYGMESSPAGRSVTTCRAHLARAVTDLLGSAIRYGNVLPTVNSI